MSQPPAFSRAFSFTNFQAQNPSLALPGSSVDLELNNAKVTLDAVLANLARIQRDDGAVANASIGLDQLKAEVPVGFNAPSVWVTATAYTAGSSTVFNGSGFYRCLITHTSGTFATDLAALKWQLIVNLAAVPLVTAAQIAVTPSGLLTTNAQTSLQALDTGKAATSHTHVSSALTDSTAAGRALLTAADATAQNVLLGTTSLGFQSGDIKETSVLVLQSGWYYCDGSNKSRVTDVNLFNAITIQQSCSLTSGSAVVTVADTTNGAGNTPMAAGIYISGTGIQAGARILSVDSATQITMTLTATGSGTTSLVFAPFGIGDGSSTFGLPNRAALSVGRDNASGTASNIMQVSTTYSITTGTAAGVVASAAGLYVGMVASSPKLPLGTRINAISGTSVTFNNNATGTLSGAAIRFSPLLDAQAMGSDGGALSQSTTLVVANLPSVTSVNASQAISVSSTANVLRAGGGVTQVGSGLQGITYVSPTDGALTSTGTASISVTSTSTTSTPIIKQTVQPTIVMNYIIKR